PGLLDPAGAAVRLATALACRPYPLRLPAGRQWAALPALPHAYRFGVGPRPAAVASAHRPHRGLPRFRRCGARAVLSDASAGGLLPSFARPPAGRLSCLA